MDMDSHRARHELRCSHGSSRTPIIPTVVESSIGDGKAGRKGRRHIVENDRDALVPALACRAEQPVVALAVSAFRCAPAIDVGPAVKADSFGEQGVVDHAAHRVRRRRVEPRNENESGRDGGIKDG